MTWIDCLLLNPPARTRQATIDRNPVNSISFSPVQFYARPIAVRSPLRSSKPVAGRYDGDGDGDRYELFLESNGDSSTPFKDPALDVDGIKSVFVRLYDEQQKMVGIISKKKAIQMAADAGLLLVVLSADADPPVLRLLGDKDFKKYKFEQNKKKRLQQKRSAANRMDLKELKMGYNIESHDYSVKLKAAHKFLKNGDKVKVVVNMKGRQNVLRNGAIQLINRFHTDIGELATVESESFAENDTFIVFAPNKAAIQKAQNQPNKNEAQISEESAIV